MYVEHNSRVYFLPIQDATNWYQSHYRRNSGVSDGTQRKMKAPILRFSSCWTHFRSTPQTHLSWFLQNIFFIIKHLCIKLKFLILTDYSGLFDRFFFWYPRICKLPIYTVYARSIMGFLSLLRLIESSFLFYFAAEDSG